MIEYNSSKKAFRASDGNSITNELREHRSVEKIRPQEFAKHVRLVTLGLSEKKPVKLNSSSIELRHDGHQTSPQTCVEYNEVEGQLCSLRETNAHSMIQ